jgi:phosphoribosylformimino-5-aminoimidazole carboxamide ribotide isomerase
VKQIVGGTLSESVGTSEAVENFVSDKPSSYYSELYRQDDLTGGHVIILGKDNSSVAAAKDALLAWPMGLQLGGGVNTSNAKLWLDAGASKLIVTSFVFSGGQLQEERLNELVQLVGKERIVLDLSCRKRDGKYFVVTDRWQTFTDLKVSSSASLRSGSVPVM